MHKASGHARLFASADFETHMCSSRGGRYTRLRYTAFASAFNSRARESAQVLDTDFLENELPRGTEERDGDEDLIGREVVRDVENERVPGEQVCERQELFLPLANCKRILFGVAGRRPPLPPLADFYR